MKRVYLNLRIALRSLASFKVRTALAMLGAFLGTFSLIVVSNLSDSLTKKTEAEAAKLGRNLLIVRSGLVARVGPQARLFSEATNLTIEDADVIAAGSTHVSDVAPTGNKAFPVRYGNVILQSVLILGVTPNYTSLRNFQVKDGSFFFDRDMENVSRVAVLGSKVAEKLFGNESPLGRHILIWRVPCQVIGVMEEKGVDISGADLDNQIFVPLSTFLRRFVNKDFVNSVTVQVVDGDSLPAAKAEIEDILRKRHKIGRGKKDDFTVIDLKDVIALQAQAMDMIRVLGRIAATISFFIGGLGILSIMILIVNERRLEIGIRRAVGSRKRDIVLQFLIESSFISWSGGTVGLVVSLLATMLIFTLADLPFAVSLGGLAVAFFASVAVGAAAGIYPSQKATKIQPVDVLRS